MHKYLLLILLGLWNTASAQEHLSIDQAIRVALENNYSIRIAQKDADQSNAGLGNAGMLPSLSLQGDFSGRTPQDPNLSAGLHLNWTVFDGLKMFASYQKFKTLDEINQVAVRAEIENCIRQVINQYYLIVSAQQQLKSIEQTLDVSRVRHEHVSEKYSIGSASKLDVLNARVDFNTDSSAYLREIERILSAKALLNQLMARPIDSDFSTDENIPIATLLDYGEIFGKAMAQNTELNIIRLQYQISQQSKKEINSELMPSLHVNAGYDLLFLPSSNNFSYGITAKMNLFNGLETDRKRKNIRHELEKVEYMETAKALDIEARLRVNFINYQTNKGLVDLEKENIEVAKQNMDISLERYRLGNLTALELREAQRNYLNAINRYTNSLYLTKISETGLLQLAGELGQKL